MVAGPVHTCVLRGRLEKEIKKYVSDEKCTVEYFDLQKMSVVKVSPTIKTTYDVDVAGVELECWPEYIETKQSVNLKMMQASPACADYLEAVATEKVIATKRVIKN